MCFTQVRDELWPQPNSYQPIEPLRTDSPFGGNDVKGVGTIELQASRRPGSSETATLVLENVMHCPDHNANGFHASIYTQETGTDVKMESATIGSERDGRPLWYTTDFCGLQKLVSPGWES